MNPKTYDIALIPGDGIGPEVTQAVRQVLDAIAAPAEYRFHFSEYLAGGMAIDATGQPLPEATVSGCKASHAVFLGAVGGPKWDGLPGDKRPEKALLGLRSALGLFANLRPAVLHAPLASACPLHPTIAARGIDILFVRELTGGMYFGDCGRRDGRHGPEAYDTEAYSVMEVERIARKGFELARKRDKRLTSVDKANVLESSRLWRETVIKVHADYPDVTLDHLYVDNASMQLLMRPDEFDVVVTTNMFGDILSDEAAMITGSIGMLPSASLGADGTPGMYEPIHGSAPDIAGKDLANPLASILSAAMMLRWSLGLHKAAERIERAVQETLNAGMRTRDIVDKDQKEQGMKLLGTRAMTEQVLARLP